MRPAPRRDDLVRGAWVEAGRGAVFVTRGGADWVRPLSQKDARPRKYANSEIGSCKTARFPFQRGQEFANLIANGQITRVANAFHSFKKMIRRLCSGRAGPFLMIWRACGQLSRYLDERSNGTFGSGLTRP